jgi:hypothetical protein
VDWYVKKNVANKVKVFTNSTDKDTGRATYFFPVPMDAATNDTYYIFAAYGGSPSADHKLAQIKRVRPQDIKIKMQRYDSNYQFKDLADGGTVSSVIYNHSARSDKAVIISIDNLPTQFMSMALVETPAVSGDLLRPSNPLFSNGRSVINPERNRKYFFKVANHIDNTHPNLSTYSSTGPARFRLYGNGSQTVLDSTTVIIAGEYFDFTCARTVPPATMANHTGSCTGDLVLYSALRQSLESHSAESGNNWKNLQDGGTFYPALPNGTYTFSGTADKLLRSGFCDNLANCWWAPFNEAPQDNNAIPARPRTELGMHPDAGNDSTRGCIGFDPSFDSSDFRNLLDQLTNHRGSVEVIVH